MIEERFPFTNTNCPTFSSVAGGMCRCKRQEVENASTNIFTWCTEQDGMALIVETFFFFFSWHARLRLLTAKRVCIRGHESFSCIIYYFQQRHSSGLKNNIPDEKEMSFFFSFFPLYLRNSRITKLASNF